MARQQKPVPEPESEWEEIDSPDQWEEIPDPTLSAEPPQEAPAAATAPPSLAEQVFTWPNAVRFGLSTIGDLAAPVTFGAGPFIGAAIGEGFGRGMEGLPFDPSIMALEGALNYIPGGGRATRTGIKGFAEQVLRSGRQGAIQGAVGTFPRHQANLGNLFKPWNWEMPSAEEFGTQTAAGGAIGGTVGGGVHVGKPVVRFAGRPVSAAGQVMQKYTPFSEMAARTAGGTVGSAYGKPGMVAGMFMARPPRFVRGIEQAAGRGVENVGNWMQGMGIDRNAIALEEFWGRNSSQQPPPNAPVDTSGGVDPIMESPIYPPDSEVPELQQLRESTNRNVWDPEETTVNETSDPILESPINPPDSEVELLRQLHQSSTGQWYPPPTTVNEVPMGPFDKYGMIDSDVPEPGAAPVVPPKQVGTGSAFERYMQSKPKTVGEDAPQVDAAGNPVLSMEAPLDLPAVAKGQNISVNPDGDIQWPGVPNAEVIQKVEAQGFKFDSATNIFRKITNLAKEALDRLTTDEAGTFEPGKVVETLKQLLGRDPTDAEVGAAVRRQVKPGETTGKVAPFLSPEERAQRLDDLANPANPENQSPKFQDIGWEERASDTQSIKNITSLDDLAKLEQDWKDVFEAVRDTGDDAAFDHAMDMLTRIKIQREALSLQMPAFLREDPQFAPSGDIGQLRAQAVMDPRMTARVEAGGAREFDFTPQRGQQELPGMMREVDTGTPVDADEINRVMQQAGDRLKAPPTPSPEQLSMLDELDDSIIQQYLSGEDARPPEMTDLAAWDKIKALGQKLYSDESGHLDPNELWWNLYRLFNRAPSETELTDALNREGYQPGGRAEEVRNEISNKPWADHVLNAIEGMPDRPTYVQPGETPTWDKSVKEMLRDKLANDVKKLWEPAKPGLMDAADDLWDALESGKVGEGDSLVGEIQKGLDEVTDVNVAKAHRDDLGAMAGNAENEYQKSVFNYLYEMADKRYRRLRNPGLESPKPNRDMPTEDVFGPKPEVPPQDKWDADIPDDLYSRPHNPEEHGQPWYWKYGSGMLSNWPPTSLESIIRDIPEADLKARLSKSSSSKETTAIETELSRRSNLPKNETPEQQARREADEDRTPSNLPPGHVDIEGTRFIDLSQQIDGPLSKSSKPDMVEYKSKWVKDVFSMLDNLPKTHDVGLDNALSRLKADLKIKNPSRAQIMEMKNNINKLSKHPSGGRGWKDAWADLNDSGGIEEADLENYFKKKPGDEGGEKMWVPKK